MSTTQILTDIARNDGAFDMLLINGSTGFGFVYADPLLTQQVTNLAPTFAVGGSGAYNTDAFQALPWPGTSTGGDKDVFESGDLRYNRSDGGVATQYDNYLTLASQWNSWDTSQTAVCYKILDFNKGNGFVMLGEATKCRAYNTTTQAWGNQGTFAHAVTDMATDDTYFVVAVGNAEDYWSWDGTTWSQPAASVKAEHFAFYNGVLYRSLGANLYVSSDSGQSAKGWGTVRKKKVNAVPIPVGWTTTTIAELKVASGFLLIAKPEGWFKYDGTTVSQVLNAEVTADVTNFTGATESQGLIYWVQKNQVMKGLMSTTAGMTQVSAIAPRMTGTANRERYWHGYPRITVAGPSALYAAFNQGEGTYAEVLMYNGVGWHQIYRSAASHTLGAFGFSRLLGWLIVNEGGTTYYKRLTNIGTSEYPDFAASGDIISPKFDGGFPAESKLWNSVVVHLEGMTANNSVAVKYILDGAAAVTAATLSNVNGDVEVILGKENGQVQGVNLQIELVITRNSGDITDNPRVKWPVVIYGLPAPKATDAHRVSVIIDERQRLKGKGYGRLGSYATTNGHKEFLEDCRASTNTLILIDQFGAWRRVRMTNLGYNRHSIAAANNNIREVASADLAFLDISTGLKRWVESPITISCAASTEA